MQRPSTPKLSHIDAFFAEYPNYSYDRTQPITTQFDGLTTVLDGDGQDTKKVREKFNRAMVLDFNQTFGENANSLDAWQRLCTMLSVSSIPGSIRGCRQVGTRGVQVPQVVNLHSIDRNLVEFMSTSLTSSTPPETVLISRYSQTYKSFGNIRRILESFSLVMIR